VDSFALAQWKPNQRFTYGYRRRGFGGCVGIILLSAVVKGYESMERAPQRIEYLGAVMVASVIGFFWVMRQLRDFGSKLGKRLAVQL